MFKVKVTNLKGDKTGIIEVDALYPSSAVIYMSHFNGNTEYLDVYVHKDAQVKYSQMWPKKDGYQLEIRMPASFMPCNDERY